MTSDNFAACLQAFTRRQPFRPFLLQLITGEMLLIAHPEAIRMHGEIALLVETSHRRRLFDANAICQFLEVPRPELPQEPQPPTQE